MTTDNMDFSEQELWVTMNDGVRLDASVFTPAGNTPDDGYPAVLLVHGHGDAGSKAAMYERAQRYAGRGYLTACYSVRGQGCSEGLTFHMGAREIFDIQAVIDWMLHDLPVHPQKLGVAGSSQGGWHSYMAAAHHPQVATVVPENIFTDYSQFAVRNGCLTRWFFTRTMRRRIMSSGLQELARQWALAGEWERLQEWVRPTSPLIFVDRIRCPVFILHGWHDMGMPPNEVITMFQQLNVPKKLYLGGGGHDGMDAPEVEQLRQSLVDRWLDYWLKGEDNGILDEEPVTYALRPEWEHHASSVFPPKTVQQQAYYLHVDNRLLPAPPDSAETHANVTNRPLDPDYTLRSAIYDDMEGVPAGLAHETVHFDAPPIEQPLHILGAPAAKFHMLANETAFQVHARLLDVAPDGTTTLITRGHFGTRRNLPGHHVEVEIDLRAIAYVLSAGHHLRLEVCNYDADYVFPYFTPYYARLYHDNAHPSRIEIPTQP